MTRRRPVEPSKRLVIGALFVLIFVVVGAGVARNDLNYTTTAGGLFVIVGYILRGKSDEGDDE